MDFRNFYQEYKFDWVTLKNFYRTFLPDFQNDNTQLQKFSSQFPVLFFRNK